jgi:hypothetical protein
MNGTANNYMAGSLGIGSTTLTGYNLRVSKSITGATTSLGIYSSGAVQSDVTINGIYFGTDASTAATTFTLGNLIHYRAALAGIGAGSTVTQQIGFVATSSIVGATSNFGFKGEIPSGSGRWNLYMDGTASNYMNGNLLLGSTTDGGQKLQVTGTTQLTATADAVPLTISSYSVTGSGASNALSITGAWNTTGNPTGLFINITNTASGSGARLIDLRLSNTSLFYVGKSIGGYTTGGPVSLNGYGIGNSTVAIYGVDANNNVSTSSVAMQFSDANTGEGYGYYFHSGQYVSKAYTSGTGGFVSILRGFAPTSGTGVFNALNVQPTINQTGGANGITRGLYINPTITAAADWRAIEVSSGVSVMAASSTASASIRIPSGTAPTSPVNGDIWQDGTDLKIRIGGVTKTFTLV